MEITYRTKQKYGKGYHGTGIEIRYQEAEQKLIDRLQKEMEAEGFKFTPSPFPKDWKSGHICHFNKDGSYPFGLQNDVEHTEFIAFSYTILKRYDPNVTQEIFLYDNN